MVGEERAVDVRFHRGGPDGLAGDGGGADALADLAGLGLENSNRLSATVVPAADTLPEQFRVLGYVRLVINFEIRLPARGWNRRFLTTSTGS